MPFVFKDTQKRANPFAAYTAPDGTRYARIPAELLEEVSEPVPPADYSDETYYRTEQDDAPYIVYTRKSDEQLAQLAKSKAQAAIDALDGGHPTARPLREFALGVMEKLAVDGGFTVEQLRAENHGYRKMKELDEQIAAIRSAM